MTQQLPLFTPKRRRPSSSYVNTTGETGAKLQEYERKADGQDRLILNLLKTHPHTTFTPSEVNERFGFKNWDINGVRRTLSTWTLGYKGREKLLVMTDEKRKGPKGRNEYAWKWKMSSTKL